MPYHEKQRLSIAARPSPSLLYDNLTCSSGRLAYAHLHQAVIVDIKPSSSSSDAQCRKVESQDADLVYTVKAFHHQGRSYLAIACESSLKVWDSSVSQLLYVWLPPPRAHDAGGDKATCGAFLRGVSSNIAADGSVQLCVGSSTGAVHVFSFDADDHFKPAAALEHHRAPVTALSSAYQCRRGAWSEDLVCNLVSGDEHGRLAVWEATDCATFQCKLTVDLNGVPCTSLAVRSTFVVAARLDGRVDVYGLNDGEKRAEFTGHSRWVSAMDIHPEKDLIVTASEDCTLNVWTLPIAAHKVSVLFSTTWLHSMITGVAFCGHSNDDVAAVAYDTDEVAIWRA